MAKLGSAQIYGDLTVNLDADVKGEIKEGGTLLSEKYADKTNTYTKAEADAGFLGITANAVSATKLQTARTISVAGDVTGSAAFDGTGNITITATVVNDSHTHDTMYYTEDEADARFPILTAANTYTNIQTLESAWPRIDFKNSNTGFGDTTWRVTSHTNTDNFEIQKRDWAGNFLSAPFSINKSTLITTVSSAGLFVGTNEVWHAGNFDPDSTVVGTASVLETPRTISLSGDATGSGLFDGSANLDIVVTIADDSHNHVISNVDGLQTALDGKSSTSHTHTTTPDNITIGAGGVANKITFANPGIGNSSEFKFTKSSDTAGIRVTEVSNDATEFQFYMGDNPDQAQDKFNWIITSYEGRGKDWKPLEFANRVNTMIALENKIDGNVRMGNTPYYTSGGVKNTVAEIKTGDLAISVDASGYTASIVYEYAIKFISATQFEIHNRTSAESLRSGPYTLVLGSPITLDFGVKVTFTGTAPVTGDLYDFGVFPAGEVTIGGHKVYHEGYAPTASGLATARTISISGDATGSGVFDGTADLDIEVVIADDSHNHIISNIDGLQTALDSKLDATSQAADSATVGGLNPSQFVRSDTADTITGLLEVRKDGEWMRFQNSSGTEVDSWITLGNGFDPNGWQIKYVGTTTGTNGNELRFESNWTGRYLQFDHDGNFEYYNGTTIENIYKDSYHPEADKLTTARTISVSGGATGSLSFDGSVNASMDVTITDNGHAHTIANVTGLQTALDSKLDATSQATDSATVGGLDPSQFLRSDTADTTTGNLTISKTNGRLVFNETAYNTGNSGLEFRTGANQYLTVLHEISDADIAASSGQALKIKSTDGTNTAHLEVEGNIYASNNQRVFADDYHPNADTLTTARTISLSGDATGSVSFDGSGNADISVTVVDDLHNHTIANVDGLQDVLDSKLGVSGGIISGGDLRFVSSSDTYGLYIQRTTDGASSDEYVKHTVNDTVFNVKYHNDEYLGNIKWTLENSDLENSDGSRANSGYVQITQDNTNGTRLFVNANQVYHQGYKPTPADIGASAPGHTHAASEIASGTISMDRLPVFTYSDLSQSRLASIGTNSVMEVGRYIDMHYSTANDYSVRLEATGEDTFNIGGVSNSGVTINGYAVYHANNLPTATGVGAIPATEKGAANGVATLGADGKVPLAQIPSIALNDTFVVASEAAMLALTCQIGDIAIRTDISTTFILKESNPSTLASWAEFLTPADGILSITAGTGLNGGTITDSGTISVNFGTSAGTVSEGNHTHDGRYYTETEMNSLLAAKADTHTHPYLPLAGGTMTGMLQIGTGHTLQLNGTNGGEVALKADGEDFVIVEPEDSSREWLRIKDGGETGGANASAPMLLYGQAVWYAGNFDPASKSDVHSHPYRSNSWLPTPAEIGALTTGGTAANSQLLDSLDSTQFLRSDTSDVMSGTLRFTNNNGVSLTNSTGGGIRGIDLYSDDIIRIGTTGGPIVRVHGSNFTYWDGTADRKLFHDTYHPYADALTTSRTISLTGDVTGSIGFNGSSDVSITTVVGDDSHNHTIAYVAGLQTALDNKLGLTAKAADSNLLDGYDETAFGRLAVERTWTAKQTFPSISLSSGSGSLKFTNINTGDVWFHGNEGAGDNVMSFSKVGTSNYNTVAYGTFKSTGVMYANNTQRVFADDYHPNADTLTTARTISLTGDVTGSVSFNGGSNVSITTTVADDSHNHVISNVDGLQTALDGKAATHSHPYRSDTWMPTAVEVGALASAGGNMTGDITYAGYQVGKGVYWGSTGNQAYLRQSSGAEGQLQIGSDDKIEFMETDTNVQAGYISTNNKALYMNGNIYANGSQRVFADDYHPNADKLTNARTITFIGDVTGGFTFDGTSDLPSVTMTVADNSHAHSINNITSLQTALDAKLNLAGGTISSSNKIYFGDSTRYIGMTNNDLLVSSTNDLILESDVDNTSGGTEKTWIKNGGENIVEVSKNDVKINKDTEITGNASVSGDMTIGSATLKYDATTNSLSFCF